jgi:hypothetical protein
MPPDFKTNWLQTAGIDYHLPANDALSNASNPLDVTPICKQRCEVEMFFDQRPKS